LSDTLPCDRLRIEVELENALESAEVSFADNKAVQDAIAASID